VFGRDEVVADPERRGPLHAVPLVSPWTRPEGRGPSGTDSRSRSEGTCRPAGDPDSPC
jgi:hypothetical protein